MLLATCVARMLRPFKQSLAASDCATLVEQHGLGSTEPGLSFLRTAKYFVLVGDTTVDGQVICSSKYTMRARSLRV